MKNFKRFVAILLSAVLLMSIAPLSVFAEKIPNELYYWYWDGDLDTFSYYSELNTGENTITDIDEYLHYFCSFVPQETGVYSFEGYFSYIIESKNKDEYTFSDTERTVFLTSYNPYEILELDEDFEGADKEYCYLTAGRLYYVLCYYPDYLNIAYEGVITDVKPVNNLKDLVENYDIEPFDYEDYSGIGVNELFEITFSSNTVAYIDGIDFEDGYYTDNTLTWTLLGFEKVMRYNVISLSDMIKSVKTDKRTTFIKYFDDYREMKEPVTVEINFTNGTSTEVTITDGDIYEFKGTTGRMYCLSLNIDENDNYVLWVAGEYYEFDHTVKNAGLFKNLSRYIVLKSEIRTEYSYILKSEYYTAAEKLYYVKERNERIRDLRLEFIKSIFSFK